MPPSRRVETKVIDDRLLEDHAAAACFEGGAGSLWHDVPAHQEDYLLVGNTTNFADTGPKFVVRKATMSPIKMLCVAGCSADASSADRYRHPAETICIDAGEGIR